MKKKTWISYYSKLRSKSTIMHVTVAVTDNSIPNTIRFNHAWKQKRIVVEQ